MATLACTYSRTEIEIITYLFPNATLQCLLDGLVLVMMNICFLICSSEEDLDFQSHFAIFRMIISKLKINICCRILEEKIL